MRFDQRGAVFAFCRCKTKMFFPSSELMAHTLISFCPFAFPIRQYAIPLSCWTKLFVLLGRLCSDAAVPCDIFPTSAINMKLRDIKGIGRKRYIRPCHRKAVNSLARVHVALTVWLLKKRKNLAADAAAVSFQLDRNILIAALAVVTLSSCAARR